MRPSISIWTPIVLKCRRKPLPPRMLWLWWYRTGHERKRKAEGKISHNGILAGRTPVSLGTYLVERTAMKPSTPLLSPHSGSTTTRGQIRLSLMEELQLEPIIAPPQLLVWLPAYNHERLMAQLQITSTIDSRSERSKPIGSCSNLRHVHRKPSDLIDVVSTELLLRRSLN